MPEMKQFSKNWWWLFPVLIAVFAFSSAKIIDHSNSSWADVLFILMLFSCVASVLSQISLGRQKQWLAMAVSIVFTAVAVFEGLAFNMVAALFSTAPDTFGKKHPIPEGLEYSIPLGYGDEPDSTSCFQLRNGIEGGIYKYDFSYDALPQGEIFLKCYEVGTGCQLSKDRLESHSTVKIDSTSQYGQLVNGQEFSIYEGDWGDYYAARIEVWHRDSVSRKETKLFEKVYRVEGWMR